MPDYLFYDIFEKPWSVEAVNYKKIHHHLLERRIDDVVPSLMLPVDAPQRINNFGLD